MYLLIRHKTRKHGIEFLSNSNPCCLFIDHSYEILTASLQEVRQRVYWLNLSWLWMLGQQPVRSSVNKSVIKPAFIKSFKRDLLVNTKQCKYLVKIYNKMISILIHLATSIIFIIFLYRTWMSQHYIHDHYSQHFYAYHYQCEVDSPSGIFTIFESKVNKF